jgi:hypothetical protein
MFANYGSPGISYQRKFSRDMHSKAITPHRGIMKRGKVIYKIAQGSGLLFPQLEIPLSHHLEKYY